MLLPICEKNIKGFKKLHWTGSILIKICKTDKEEIKPYQDSSTSTVSPVGFPTNKKEAQPRMGKSLGVIHDTKCGLGSNSFYLGVVSSNDPCFGLDSTRTTLVAGNSGLGQSSNGHPAGCSREKAFRMQRPSLGDSIENLN